MFNSVTTGYEAVSKSSYKVLILSVSAGTGHLRAGEALARAAAVSTQTREVLHVDALRYTNQIFRRFYGRFYVDLIKTAPTLLGWFYESQDEPWKTEKMRLMLDRMNTGPLVRMIRKFNPDLTICTHFLPAEILAHLIKKESLKTRLSIVVTDYYVHAMWLSRCFHHYFVANELSRVQLENIGFPPDRITVSGIPIDPVFEEPKEPAELRKYFSMDPALPLLLVSAGALGMGSAAHVVRALELLRTPAQVMVICGRNEKLLGQVNREIRLRGTGRIRFHATGYTTEMDAWMKAADLYIGKPGGLTVSEAMSCGLPMVIYQPIPGQEERNSDFLLEHGAAVKCNQLSTMAYQVDQILGDPARLEAMRSAARQIGQPEAARRIIQTLMNQLDNSAYQIPRDRSELEKALIKIRYLGRRISRRRDEEKRRFKI